MVDIETFLDQNQGIKKLIIKSMNQPEKQGKKMKNFTRKAEVEAKKMQRNLEVETQMKDIEYFQNIR